MSQEKLLTVREVAIFLNISEKEVMDLAEAGAIPAYKVGGVFLRFKKEQVQGFQKSAPAVLGKTETPKRASFPEKASDFFYFYDFYILSGLIIIILLILIFRA